MFELGEAQTAMQKWKGHSAPHSQVLKKANVPHLF